MALEKLSFKGGIHIDDHKDLTKRIKTSLGKEPERVTIALSQHIGAECQPLVKRRDLVKVGQKIGESESTLSAPVHSSVSGEVESVASVVTPSGVKCDAITIVSDGENTLGYEVVDRDYEDLSPEEIVAIIREAGIVGLGGAAFPTAVKLSPPKNNPIDTVLVNGAECEPFLTADQRIMEDQPEEIMIGLKIAMKAVGAKEGFVAIEENKPAAITAMRNVALDHEGIEVATLVPKYPQGDEKRLINAVLDRVVPAGGLPMNVGVVVINAYTLYAIYEAVVKGKPLYERIVTVTGEGVNKPLNHKVKVGVDLKYLFEEAEGFKSDPGLIIVGGPMMGTAQSSLEAPVTKAVGGVIVFSQEEINRIKPTACIQCKRCVKACPVGLSPAFLELMITHDAFERARDESILDCIECGSCSYICPSRRPLIETIRMGKTDVRKSIHRG